MLFNMIFPIFMVVTEPIFDSEEFITLWAFFSIFFKGSFSCSRYFYYYYYTTAALAFVIAVMSLCCSVTRASP